MEGIHPTLRHVPPREPRISTHAVLRPICPALMAATYPPGPPPTTTMSYCSWIGVDVEKADTPPRAEVEIMALVAGRRMVKAAARDNIVAADRELCIVG